MTVVAVLSQPLRQKEAAIYLQSRTAVRRVVVTRYLSALEMSEFPSDTDFLSWSPAPKPPPSSRVASGLSRLKRWVRSGSSLGLRIDRWMRSAEWRLRYLDRALAVVESRNVSRWDFRNPALVETLESQASTNDDCEVAVFDLFDLPAVLTFARDRECRVTVQ